MCQSVNDNVLPLALILISQFLVFTVEPIVLGGHLFRVRCHTIHFAFTMIHHRCRCASERHLSHRPIRIIIQIRWQNSYLKLVIVIKINDAVRTINVIEWSETFHGNLMIESMRSQFTFGGEKDHVWLITCYDNSIVTRHVI